MIDRTDTTLDLSYISRELLKKEGVYSGGWLRARVGKQTLKNVFYIIFFLVACKHHHHHFLLSQKIFFFAIVCCVFTAADFLFVLQVRWLAAVVSYAIAAHSTNKLFLSPRRSNVVHRVRKRTKTNLQCCAYGNTELKSELKQTSNAVPMAIELKQTHLLPVVAAG